MTGRLILGLVLIGIAAFIGVTAEAVNGQTVVALLFLAAGAHFALSSVVQR